VLREIRLDSRAGGNAARSAARSEALPSVVPKAAAQEFPPAAFRLGRAVADGVLRRTRTVLALVGALSQPAAARAAVQRLRDAVYSAAQLALDDIPELPWNARLGPRRRLALARLPMQGVARIRARLGGTLNDVVLCVLAGGLHRYLEANGVATRRLELTALVPVSLRSPEEARSLGNRISALLVPLAVDLARDEPRLAATRAITARLKERAAWTGIDALLALIDELPAGLVALVGQQLRLSRLANVVATNVPGPRETRYLCGRRVEALYGVVPVVDGIGLGLAVFSYDGQLHVSLLADADLVPDLEKLRQGIEASFGELLGPA
jgi:WS/DGAT/MGAT family acyltransferase